MSDAQYRVTARFEDGVVHEYDCGENETLLAAALRQDVRLLCQCKKAFCGSCKALCSEGDYEFGDRVNIQVLHPEEEEEGVVVTCDTFPRSDVVLEFPYTSDRLGMMTAPQTKATVVEVGKMSSTVYRLVLQAVDDQGVPQRFDFTPGQYVEISTADSEEGRAFSLANTPNDQGLLEFMIRLVPGGYYASYLEHRAAAGQSITVRGPFGEFVLRHHQLVEDFELDCDELKGKAPAAFVGGSTGLAPLVSMLRDLRARQYKGECHLFFGMQDSATMFYEAELRDLAKDIPGLVLHLALVDPPENWDGFRGNAVDAFRAYFSKAKAKPTSVYLCGPGPMIDAALRVCADLGVPDDRVHREEFVATGS